MLLDVLYDTLEKGGWVLGAIFVLMVWAWYLLLIKHRELAAERDNYNEMLETMVMHLRKGQTEKAMLYIASKPGKFAAYLQGMAGWHDTTAEGLTFRHEELITHASAGLQKHFKTIAVFASVAPLLGLLGTVSGMVSTFTVIHLFGSSNPVLMADGIAESLITTQAGLVAAFPILLFLNRLKNRTAELEKAMEKAYLRLHTLSQQKKKPRRKAGQTKTKQRGTP